MIYVKNILLFSSRMSSVFSLSFFSLIFECYLFFCYFSCRLISSLVAYKLLILAPYPSFAAWACLNCTMMSCGDRRACVRLTDLHCKTHSSTRPICFFEHPICLKGTGSNLLLSVLWLLLREEIYLLLHLRCYLRSLIYPAINPWSLCSVLLDKTSFFPSLFFFTSINNSLLRFEPKYIILK